MNEYLLLREELCSKLRILELFSSQGLPLALETRPYLLLIL